MHKSKNAISTDIAWAGPFVEHLHVLYRPINIAYWEILHAFVSADNFQKNLKNNVGIPSECQTVWIQIMPDILSGLIWV